MKSSVICLKSFCDGVFYGTYSRLSLRINCAARVPGNDFQEKVARLLYLLYSSDLLADYVYSANEGYTTLILQYDYCDKLSVLALYKNV